MTVPTTLPEQLHRIGRIHHVAVVVRDLEVALAFYRDILGLELEVVQEMAHDRVRIAFLPIGESKLELVEPTDGTTGVARFLASKGEGFHHVCLEVANLSESLTRLAIDGVELIEAPGGPSWSALGY